MQGREETQKYLASLFSLPFNLIIRRLALPLAKLSLAGNQLALEPGKGSVQGQTSGIQSERMRRGSEGQQTQDQHIMQGQRWLLDAKCRVFSVFQLLDLS